MRKLSERGQVVMVQWMEGRLAVDMSRMECNVNFWIEDRARRVM